MTESQDKRDAAPAAPEPPRDPPASSASQDTKDKKDSKDTDSKDRKDAQDSKDRDYPRRYRDEAPRDAPRGRDDSSRGKHGRQLASTPLDQLVSMEKLTTDFPQELIVDGRFEARVNAEKAGRLVWAYFLIFHVIRLTLELWVALELIRS